MNYPLRKMSQREALIRLVLFARERELVGATLDGLDCFFSLGTRKLSTALGVVTAGHRLT